MKNDDFFTVYSVLVDGSKNLLYGFSGKQILKVGDFVIVDFGIDNEERIGKITAINSIKSDDLPFPIDEIRFIKRKADDKSILEIEKKKSIQKRLSGRQAEYFMFMDDE